LLGFIVKIVSSYKAITGNKLFAKADCKKSSRGESITFGIAPNIKEKKNK
jgi:hypothetical protein